MPEFQLDHGTREAGAAFNALDAFTQGYLEAMFFTSTGTADDSDLQHATVADLAPETWLQVIDDCADFQSQNREDLNEAIDNNRINGFDDKTAGHCFWYTRAGHGTGFWDRDLDDLGGKLTAACRPWRELGLYRGDDNQLYLS